MKTERTAGYDESPAGSDPRFIYKYAAESQKIAMGNAQDDPGLFIPPFRATFRISGTSRLKTPGPSARGIWR